MQSTCSEDTQHHAFRARSWHIPDVAARAVVRPMSQADVPHAHQAHNEPRRPRLIACWTVGISSARSSCTNAMNRTQEAHIGNSRREKVPAVVVDHCGPRADAIVRAVRSPQCNSASSETSLPPHLTPWISIVRPRVNQGTRSSWRGTSAKALQLGVQCRSKKRSGSPCVRRAIFSPGSMRHGGRGRDICLETPGSWKP